MPLPWAMRGVMLDASRQTESYEFYGALIPQLAGWGFNTILLHLADDQGCAVLLDSPRVLPTTGALTVPQWQALTLLASRRGIEVIPEVECLGHTGYVTRLPEYAELREPPSRGGQFWSICPTHPAALGVIREVLEAINTVFPGRFLHIGMDEADIGGSKRLKADLAERPLWRIFGDFTVELNAIVRGFGRQTLAWGDHLLSSRQLMEMLPRDILICNWHYGRGHSEDYAESSRSLLEAGFHVVTCPSGCAHGTQYVPHSDNIANIRDFDRACRSLSHPSIMGMILTMWSGYRHLPEIGLPIMAYGGRCFSGQPLEFRQLMNQFVAQRYGMKNEAAAEQAGGAIADLHEGHRRNLLELWLVAAENSSALETSTGAIQKLAECHGAAAATLRAAAHGATVNAGEYGQWVFTAEFVRDLAQLRLQEIVAGGRAIPTERDRLGRSFWKCAKTWRSYLGTRAEEPALGQAPRFRPVAKDDNPAEHLALWRL